MCVGVEEKAMLSHTFASSNALVGKVFLLGGRGWDASEPQGPFRLCDPCDPALGARAIFDKGALALALFWESRGFETRP